MVAVAHSVHNAAVTISGLHPLFIGAKLLGKYFGILAGNQPALNSATAQHQLEII